MGVQIDLKRAESVVRCSVSGDLDLAAQDHALKQLLPVAAGPKPVVLDLSEVQFIDSTGLRVLLACQNKAEETGTQLLLDGMSPAVQRLFDVTKIGVRFNSVSGG